MVRDGVVVALGNQIRARVRGRGARSTLVAGALIRALADDDDDLVKRTSYEVLVQEFDGPSVSIPFDFDARVHVDWAWIEGLRARLGIHG